MQKLLLGEKLKRLTQALMGFILLFNTSAFAKAPLCSQVLIAPAEVRAQLSLVLKNHSLSQYETQIPNWILSWGARKLLASRSASDRQDRVLKLQTVFETIHRLQDPSVPGRSAEALWVERSMMDRSVATVLKDYGYDRPRQEWLIRRLVNQPAIKFILSPSQLPGMKDRALDATLLENILRDGPEKYEHDIRSLYKSSRQYQVDSYQAFRRSYKVVMTLVFALVAWNHFEDMKENLNEKNKDKFEESLTDLDELLGALDEELAHRGLYK